MPPLPLLIQQLAACLPLAQAAPWDDPPAAPTTLPRRPMSFGDFQRGFQQYNDGQTDPTLRNGLLIMVAVVAVVALIVHLRQRARAQRTPDSEHKLARELARIVPFPFATRMLLAWVARSTGTGMAILLLSPQAFDESLATWASQPTFAPARRWGRSRLLLLRGILFESA